MDQPINKAIQALTWYRNIMPRVEYSSMGWGLILMEFIWRVDAGRYFGLIIQFAEVFAIIIILFRYHFSIKSSFNLLLNKLKRIKDDQNITISLPIRLVFIEIKLLALKYFYYTFASYNFSSYRLWIQMFLISILYRIYRNIK